MNKLREILFLKSIKGIGKAKIYRKYWRYLEEGMNMDKLEKSVASEESGLAVSDISSARETAERLYESLINEPDINIITAFDDDYPEKLNVMSDLSISEH